MEEKDNPGSTEHQVGVIVGKLEGLTTAITTLSNRFEEHLKEHRQGWLWIFPTLISLATLVVLVFHFRI